MGLRQIITATDSDRSRATACSAAINGKPADYSEGPTDQREREVGLCTNGIAWS
jgi:hypothetical protein